jgi:diketogulonate reductase-like aldo/keto reductase
LINDYGYDETMRAFDKSACKLNVDQIDLLILRQALPSDFDKNPCYLPRPRDPPGRLHGPRNRRQQLHDAPSHPAFQQREVQNFETDHCILNQAQSPIGGITYYRDRGLNGALEDPVIGSIARAHGESPAQVVLRWGLHQGRSVIPKSTKPGRMAENLDVFDFQLTDEQLAALDALKTGRRGGREPEDVTLAASGKPILET